MAAMPVNFVILFSLIITLFYLLGIHYLVTRVEDNACEMTYMFEYPQYVELSLAPDIRKKYPRYSLYGYSEGSKTEELRRMKFNGVPVLYIPGSGGSHKQGRSLASIALRKALNSRSPVHFDFFLVDFNEDLSGVYGGVLDGQTKFVIACIQKVLSLYRQSAQSPSSVVLIGHSAGGLVAKGVFTDPVFDVKSVRLIITLATPHYAPVVQSDYYITDYYSRVANIWSGRPENVSHVTLVSLGGGERDVIVRSDLINDRDGNVNVLTTAVPGVWCSMDHLSITWCKQLILTLVRALFDSVDLQTKQITDSKDYTKTVFQYHLLKRSAGKKFGLHSSRGAFERNGKWVENLLRQFTAVEKKGLKTTQFFMIRLFHDPKHEVAFLEAINLNIKDWVYGCIADYVVDDQRICDDGFNLSNLTEIIPAKNLRRKIVHLNMMDLKEKGFTHIVVRIPPISSFVQVNVDVHRLSDRVITYPVPRISALSGGVVVEKTADNAVYYQINLSGMTQVWQAFSLSLEAITCKTATSHASFSFSAPWADETRHFVLVDQKQITASIMLTSPRPAQANDSAMLKLILDPSCKYRVSLAPDRLAVAAQIARYYSVLLPGYLVAVLIMTLRRQLEGVDSGTGVVFFHNALAQSARKYYILLQTAIIGSKLIGSRFLSRFLPMPDLVLLQEENMDFFFLPIILFAVATAVVYLAGAIVYVTIVISGQAAHKLAFRFLAQTVTGFVSWSEWVFSALQQLPFVAATILISLSCATCGGLALCLSAAFYFLKLCKLYEDYLEDLFKLSLKLVARTIKNVTSGGKSTSSESSTEKVNQLGEEMKNEGQESAKKDLNEKKDEESGGASEGVEDDTNLPNNACAVPTSSQELPALSTLEEIHFHVTLFLLYAVTAATTVPSVLAWSRSFYESTQLVRDPAWWPSIVLCAAGSVLWYGGIPKPNEKLSRATSPIFFALATFCIMYGSISLYRLAFLSSAAALYLVLHQISANYV